VLIKASERKLDVEESDTLDSEFNLKGKKRCININLTEGLDKHNHGNISDNTAKRFINRALLNNNPDTPLNPNLSTGLYNVLNALQSLSNSQ
ncbi:hypothetical protein ALC57_00664, partial [Trachymyrmex cornetzi]